MGLRQILFLIRKENSEDIRSSDINLGTSVYGLSLSAYSKRYKIVGLQTWVQKYLEFSLYSVPPVNLRKGLLNCQGPPGILSSTLMATELLTIYSTTLSTLPPTSYLLISSVY